MKARIHVGILGTGPWGRKIHHTLITELRDRAAVSWFLGRGAAPDGIIREERLRQVDAVVLAVPAPAVHTLAMQVLAAGKALFIEKPMALNAADAEIFHNRARADGIPVLVDHVLLFDPKYEALKRWVAEQGGTQVVAATATGPGPYREWGIPRSGLWDWGPHAVAWALDLLGDWTDMLAPTEIAGDRGALWELRLYHSRRRDSILNFGNGAPEKHRRLVVNTVSNSGALLALDGDLLVLGGQQAHVEGPAPLTNALGVFLDAVRGKSDARMGTELGRQVVRTLWRCESLMNDAAARRGG